jgi:uncharacterized membrane protein YoaK (UPF0700 family)
MQEIIKFFIGIAVLILGIPLGNFLAKQTKEELRSGQKYFIIIIWLGLIGGLAGLIIGSDALMFSMFFISIVTSRSILRKNNKK